MFASFDHDEDDFFDDVKTAPYGSTKEYYHNKSRNFSLSLKKHVLSLATYETMDLTPPEPGDKIIYLPVEMNGDTHFFTRMFLLRNHRIDNVIVSKFDLLQYQIGVKASNETLILLVYGLHFLKQVRDEDSLKQPIGSSLCQNVNTEVYNACQALAIAKDYCDWCGTYYKLNRAPREDDEIRPIPWSTATFCERFGTPDETDWFYGFECWIKENFNKASADYKKQFVGHIRWKNEFRLYLLCKFWYPETVFQYYPDWLQGQSIDVFITELNTGIEYQGMQHYQSVSYFGGEEKFSERKAADRRKKNKSKKHIKLVSWSYKDRVVFSSVMSFFEKTEAEAEEKLILQPHITVAEFLNNVSVECKREAALAAGKKVKKSDSNVSRVPEMLICQYTPGGEYVAQFLNIKDAAKSVGVSVSSIQKCLIGERHLSSGFAWRRMPYGGVLENIEIELKSKSALNTGLSTPVLQIDSHTGEVLAEYKSLRVASEAVGVDKSCISAVLKGKQRTAGGFYWVHGNKDA